ncbi:MAG TPA: galactofuranose ABC transporter, permease protein YjfF [Phycisphaerae bacterium]|nr:galactofuranose ABC transporter, permease protein YjfF [Phycisphaerae bacterium]
MRRRIPAKYIPLAATALVLVALYTAGCLSYPNFASPRVAVDLLGDNAFLGVAAIGATFVILSGGIDLSVGSVVAFTSILIASLVGEHGVHPLPAIAIALAVGAALGSAMGCLIHFYRLPPFLVTLAGMFFARGMGFVVREQSLGIKHAFYVEDIIQNLAIPVSRQVSIPFTAVCFVVVFVAGLYVAHYTRFGRTVYAIGGDEQSARLMGLPIGRTKILIYTCAGLFSALAGVVRTFYMQSGDPASCVGLELDAIAAVVIGGTLLSGRVGFVAGTGMGVLILGLIQTIINFQGNLNTWWTKIVVGLLVLVFILLQNVVAAASGRSGKGG